MTRLQEHVETKHLSTDERGDLLAVTFSGRQVRSATLQRWAQDHGLVITEQVRRLPAEPGTWSVEVRVQAS